MTREIITPLVSPAPSRVREAANLEIQAQYPKLMVFLVDGFSAGGGAGGDTGWAGVTAWCDADFPAFDVTGSAPAGGGDTAALGTGAATETAGLGKTSGAGAVSASLAEGSVSTGDALAAGALGAGADLRKKYAPVAPPRRRTTPRTVAASTGGFAF